MLPGAAAEVGISDMLVLPSNPSLVSLLMPVSWSSEASRTPAASPLGSRSMLLLSSTLVPVLLLEEVGGEEGSAGSCRVKRRFV